MTNVSGRNWFIINKSKDVEYVSGEIMFRLKIGMIQKDVDSGLVGNVMTLLKMENWKGIVTEWEYEVRLRQVN